MTTYASNWLRFALLLTASVVLILATTGCSIVGHNRVQGWPKLSVVENKVEHRVMRDHCSKYAPFWADVLACAEINLSEGACTIWYVYETELEHERLHCDGYDHIGGNTLEPLYLAWKAKNQ